MLTRGVARSAREHMGSVVATASDVTAAPQLSFLSKYFDLCELLDEIRRLDDDADAIRRPAAAGEDRAALLKGKFRAAAEIVVRLLATGVAPKRFWAHLLHLAVPLLARGADDAPLVSADDSLRLMACLEELVLSHQKDTYLSILQREHETSAQVEDRVAAVRLALTRNLAHALMYEQSVA